MFAVERIVAVIKPTQNMLDFMQSLPNADEKRDLDQLRRDCTALLIPAFPGPKQAQRFIDRHYVGILNNEMESWDVPKQCWPQPSLDLFHQLFDVEFHSLVYDIAEFASIAN